MVSEMFLIILVLLVLWVVLRKKKKKNTIEPEICDFDIQYNLDKRSPQSEEEVEYIAERRKETAGQGKPCTYRYTDWSECFNGVQTRAVISSSPKNCVGTPILQQSCTGTPPPSSGNKVLFIDFDGHTVTGTQWNYIPEIVCASSGLGLEEQLTVLALVESRYALFNVIVTTDEAVYNAAAKNKRMRCIVTESWEWYGQVGGVALLDSFSWNDDTPCFVFSSLLGYSLKMISGAIAHELGHTVGLKHQAVWDVNCIKTSNYNPGCCGKAPIMGVPYYQSEEEWIIGPTPDACLDIQDDFFKLKGVLGTKQL